MGALRPELGARSSLSPPGEARALCYSPEIHRTGRLGGGDARGKPLQPGVGGRLLLRVLPGWRPAAGAAPAASGTRRGVTPSSSLRPSGCSTWSGGSLGVRRGCPTCWGGLRVGGRSVPQKSKRAKSRRGCRRRQRKGSPGRSESCQLQAGCDSAGTVSQISRHGVAKRQHLWHPEPPRYPLAAILHSLHLPVSRYHAPSANKPADGDHRGAPVRAPEPPHTPLGSSSDTGPHASGVTAAQCCHPAGRTPCPLPHVSIRTPKRHQHPTSVQHSPHTCHTQALSPAPSSVPTQCWVTSMLGRGMGGVCRGRVLLGWGDEDEEGG